MGNAATLNVPRLRSILNSTGNTIGRGLRVVLQSDGSYALAGITIRGDMITAEDIPTGQRGNGIPIGGGGSCPVVASGTTAVTDAAYSAALGQTSNVSTNAVLLGKWLQIGAVNTLAVIELEAVA